MEPNEVNIPRWYLPSFNKQSVIKKIREIIGSTPISVSFDDIENKPTTLAGYGITDAVNINSVGTAAWKDYVDVINRYGTNLPTESAVYSLVNTMITAAQPYQGVSSTEITNGGNQLPTIGGQVYTPKLGDIVAYDNKEFVWESTNTWRELGDEGSYALKTISVWAGTGLTGGGNLTEDRTIGLSSATQDNIAKGVTAYGWGDHSQAGYALATDLNNYLPLSAGSGKPLTGDLHFNATSASKAIKWTNSSNVTANALSMSADGNLHLGYNQITNSRNAYIYGSAIYFNFNTSASQKQLVMTSDRFRPTTNNAVSLGSDSYKFANIYATTLYGNLALSYLQNADDLKAIEALTGTGFAKRTADNTWELTDTADKAEELVTSTEDDAMFTSRQVPSVAVGDVCKITSVKGKSIVWNQLVRNGNFADGTTGWSRSRGAITASGNSLIYTKGSQSGAALIYQANTKAIQGHKVYMSVEVLCSVNATNINPTFYLDADSGIVGSALANVRTRISGITTITANGASGYLRMYANTLYENDTLQVWNFQVIDLTAAGLDSLTAAEFEALYPLPYYDYNTGELINNTASGVEMLDSGGNSLGTIPLNITGLTSSGVQIFPDGMKSAGTAYDEWSGSTATKRIGVVDLGTLNWSYVSSNTFFYAALPGAKANGGSMCIKYASGIGGSKFYNDTTKDKVIGITFTNISSAERVYVRDTSYTDAATFKAAMSGVPLIYELTTPVTYTIAPLPQLVANDPDGTQRRLPEDTASSVSAPMVCDFQYGANIGDVVNEVDMRFTEVNNAIADILTQLPSSGKAEIPTEVPANPENTKTYIYYDDVNHKICVREKDGTVYSIQLNT